MRPTISIAPYPVIVTSRGFAKRISSVCDDLLELWAATPGDMPEIGSRIGLRRKFSNARAARRLIDELAVDIERIPDSEPERDSWRGRVRERLQRFGQDRLGWPDGYRRLLFGDAFYGSSVAFVREARAFDPRFTFEQLGQALRNVWIGNSFQMLLEWPVEMRPGLFAYSLLYPVTDNWLDDPGVSHDLKRSFNERFTRRLAGLPMQATDERQEAVDRLVARIEGEFPRGRFPGVYASLLAIQGGQSHSLFQHDGTDLTDGQLTRISFEKGGSSVLTDLYLVAGTADPLEEGFAFGYGVFLQLLDDLQDVEADIVAGHETIFTRAARRGALDEPTARLARFIDEILTNHHPFNDPASADRLDLIRRNCRALLVSSVAESPRRFTRRFRHALARQWPVSLRANRRLRARARSRWSQAAMRLRASSGETLT